MRYGWRARIGLLVPSVNVCFEPDLNWLLPDGVTVHASRMKRSTRLPPLESLKQMIESSIQAADLLTDCRPDIILFGCTSASVLGGTGKDRELAATIEQSTGIPTIATSTAVVEALQELGCRSIAVFTPYVESINQKERQFLEGYGFTVPVIEGLGIETGVDFAYVPPEQIYRRGKSLGKTPDADALFLSCTNIRSTPILDALENDLRKPVVSSITASVWAVLKRLEITEPLKAGGRLLKK